MSNNLHRRFALLLSLIALAGIALPASGAEAGAFWITYTEIETVRPMIDAATNSLGIMTPTGSRATIHPTSWPVGDPTVTPLPAEMWDLFMRFRNVTVPAEQSDRALDVCRQLALIAQADPQKYNLRIFFWISDASTLTAFAAGRYQIWVPASFHISCLLDSVG